MLIRSDGAESRRDAIALATIVLIWIFVLWDAFGSTGSFALFMDNEFFIGTVLSEMSGTFRSGEWPLRMTTALGGLPVYNLAQFSAFYPLYLTPLPLYETPIEVVSTMHNIMLFHVLLFAVNMFILLRAIGTMRIAAVTGAAFVAFGANSLAYAKWMNIVAPYAWLPLYLAGLIGLLENRPSARYPTMAVAGIVLLVLASPSQPLIHAVLITCVLLLSRWWCFRSLERSAVAPIPLLKLGTIAIIAFLLAAPALLPALIEFKDMIRWIGPYPPVVGHKRIPFEAFQFDQLSISELWGVLVKIKGHAVGSQYVGPIALSLASVAVMARTRSWVAVAMAALAVYALASSAGSNLGFAYINYVLPLVNKIREPSRHLFLFQFAIGILAALGIDQLRRIASSPQPMLVWRRFAIFIFAIALASLGAALNLRAHGAVVVAAIAASSLLLALAGFTAYLAYTRWRWGSEAIGLCWSVAALGILATNVNWLPPPIAASHYLNNDGVALDMAISRVADLDPQHDYRLVFEGGIDKQMAAMLASYRGVRTLSAYFNPAPLRQFQELYHHGPRMDNYLQVLGARYLLCRDCTGVVYRGFQFRESIHGYDLHEANNALPYVQVAQRIDGQFDGFADFINRASAHDLSKGLLLVETGTAIDLDATRRGPTDCVVSENTRKKNRLRYSVSCESNGILVINEFYSDPWRVAINGVESKPLRVNGNQIGVQIGPGAQVVEFMYRPWIFNLSIGLAAAGIFLILIWGLSILRHKLTRNESQSIITLS